MKWAQTQKGFTIVELLIVIVVIAILAAITIVAYNGIQNRAYDTTVQNDLATFFKKVELYKVNDSSSRYPTPGTAVNMKSITDEHGIRVTTSAYSTTVNNNVAYCYATDGSDAGVVAISRSGNAYYISTTSGGVKPFTQSWTSTASTTCRNPDTAGPHVLQSSTGFTNVWAKTTSGWFYAI
jgi:type IV pilus assembly protein PilA